MFIQYCTYEFCNKLLKLIYENCIEYIVTLLITGTTQNKEK